jgi:hypothetical protein
MTTFQGLFAIGSLVAIPLNYSVPAGFYATRPIWTSSQTSGVTGRVCSARPASIQFKLAALHCAAGNDSAPVQTSWNGGKFETYSVSASTGISTRKHKHSCFASLASTCWHHSLRNSICYSFSLFLLNLNLCNDLSPVFFLVPGLSCSTCSGS